jgi:hypothetical protein
MTTQINYNEMSAQLGEAIQHRNAMSGLYRNTPNQNTLSWRNEANLQVRLLQRRLRTFRAA